MAAAAVPRAAARGARATCYPVSLVRGSDVVRVRGLVGEACLVVALLSVLTGCDGVTIEIVQPSVGDGGFGAPGVVAWELRSTPFDGSGCPSPAEVPPSGPPSWVSPGEAADGVVLTPGRRQVLTAVGRDERCAARFFGRTCLGPEAPPRTVRLVTCAVAQPSCVDFFTWSAADRDALACPGSCSAGRCE